MRRVSRISGRRRSGRFSRPRSLRLRRHLGEASSSADAKGDMGLAIAYDVGGKGDQSFNDAAYAGLEKAEKEFGYETEDIEPTDGETDADKEQRLASLAKQGYNPVIGVGYAYATAVKAAAEQVPGHHLRHRRRLHGPGGQRRGPGLLRGAGLLPRGCRRGQEPPRPTSSASSAAWTSR